MLTLNVIGKKRCTGCERLKPLGCFDARPDRGHKPIPRCKDCNTAYRKQYMAGPARSQVLQRQAAWRAANREKLREKGRRYQKENLAPLREKARRHYATDARLDTWLRLRFGIAVEYFRRLEVEQGGVCAICGGIEEGRRLSVDHDHATGKVRGLLCGHCNRAIGLLRDDPARAERAAAYLREHGG